MYEFVRFYVCSFELQFLMPYEDSDNPNSIFYVFGLYYIYMSKVFNQKQEPDSRSRNTGPMEPDSTRPKEQQMKKKLSTNLSMIRTIFFAF